jgi:hypothetical protein
MKIISLLLIFFIVVVIVWGILKIHTYPEKIAKKKNHPQVKAIFVTSVFGLLIFPLWMFALVWAYSNAVVGRLYNDGDSADTSSQTGNKEIQKDESAKADDNKSTVNK